MARGAGKRELAMGGAEPEWGTWKRIKQSPATGRLANSRLSRKKGAGILVRTIGRKEAWKEGGLEGRTLKEGFGN